MLMPANTAVRVPKRILIADNASSGRDLVRFILGHSGYEFCDAEDGKEALEHATAFQPDLVILDLYMPKLNGCSVASLLRSMPSFGKMPILALSAEVAESDSTSLTQAGFSGCLGKPLSPAKLRSVVTDMFAAADAQEGI